MGRLCHSTDGTIAAEALLILGRAKYEAGQFDQALATFRRIYELQIDSVPLARARLAAGWALWKLSRCDEIASEIAAIKHDQQNSAEYHYLLGMAEYSNKDWTTASKELTEAAGPDERTPRGSTFLSRREFSLPTELQGSETRLSATCRRATEQRMGR